MRTNRTIRTLLLSLAFGVVASAATITTFTDRTAWLTELTMRGLQPNSPLNLGGLVQTGDSVVVGQVSGGGLTVTPLNSSQLVVADQDAPGYDFGLPQVISAQLGFPSALRFNFGSGIFGLGFDAGAFPAMGDTTDLTVEVVADGVPQIFAFPGVGGMSLSFVGVTSDMAISSISVIGGPVDPVFGNITTAAAAAVPEPGSASMVALAVGALLFWRSRLLRRKA